LHLVSVTKKREAPDLQSVSLSIKSHFLPWYLVFNTYINLHKLSWFHHRFATHYTAFVL